MRITLAALSIFALASSVAPAFAQDAPAAEPAAEETPAISITGGVTLVSDYRFRGGSLSGERPTIQGTATITHSSGFYVGVWGSGLANNTAFGSTEIDLYAGWGGTVAGLTVDANVTQYTYPQQTGAAPVDYIELLTSASKDIGPLNAKLGFGFIPKQTGYGNASAVYIYNDYALGIPSTPLKVKGHVGYNKSDFNLSPEIFDYSVGVEATYKALTFGVSYVNTDIKPRAFKEASGADGAVLFTLGASF